MKILDCDIPSDNMKEGCYMKLNEKPLTKIDLFSHDKLSLADFRLTRVERQGALDG